MRLDAAVAVATQRLSANSDSARLDAEILLCRSIDMPRSYLFAHPEDVLDELTIGRLDKLLQRRADGEPMAYIMGIREFWSHELLVSPATLVPRPETELLVELALREIPRETNWQILDLGTGCGAIAVAIASERPMCDVTATDISADALAIARENVRQASLANVNCIEGDWTEPVAGLRFNIIVSNPPYVGAGDDALQALAYEPMTALASGEDGLDAIRILASDCGALLEAEGPLIIEHGVEQQDDVTSILAAQGWSNITCHNDLAGKPRVTAARRDGK
jgi:release factor glutamine methyltransferase